MRLRYHQRHSTGFHDTDISILLSLIDIDVDPQVEKTIVEELKAGHSTRGTERLSQEMRLHLCRLLYNRHGKEYCLTSPIKDLRDYAIEQMEKDI